MLHNSSYYAVCLALAASLAASSAYAGKSLPDVSPSSGLSGQIAASDFAAPATASQVRIAPIGSRPYGKSYNEWTAEWWQWALQTPAGANPLTDLTGERCTIGQHGRLWFLVGNASGAGAITRNCRVPRDTALLIPIVNSAFFAFLNDPPETRTRKYCREQTVGVRQQQSLKLKVDGNSFGNLRSYFVLSEFFTVQLPPENLFGLSVAEVPQLLLRPSCDAGYYVILRPLPPGNHVITWTAPTNAQNITYNLSIH